MTEPSEWALREALDVVNRVRLRYNSEPLLSLPEPWEQEIALALTAARRRGIEEAADAVKRQQTSPPHTAGGFQSMILGEIYSLLDKEPT